jgi:putative component of toxin-antitoxin plasmid stabilization module
VEFYADADGNEPCRKWLEKLSATKRDALVTALEHVLERLGPDVCESEWGKPLGQGLYEFRVRNTAEEIAAMFVRDNAVPGTERRRSKRPEAVLLRLFFHTHGRKLILLLGGYDKAKDPSESRQRREIAIARRRLADYRDGQRAASRRKP